MIVQSYSWACIWRNYKVKTHARLCSLLHYLQKQDMETTKMSINRHMDREDMVCVCVCVCVCTHTIASLYMFVYVYIYLYKMDIK